MKERLGDFSIREKNLWFEFCVDVVVALYYYPNAFALMMAGDGALMGAPMVGLITTTVILAIIVRGVLSAFLHTQVKPEPKDERDHLIDARGSLFAGRVLVAANVFLIGLLVLQQIADGARVGGVLLMLTPLVIAHLLLVALMLAAMTHTVTRLVCYRRGS